MSSQSPFSVFGTLLPRNARSLLQKNTCTINDVIVNTYGYDQNGNQTTRHIGSDTFHLIYDAENRLVEVKKNGTTIAEFTYDGDGKRVMSVIGGETVRFVGGYYERKGSEITKYYMAGAARVAIRKYTIPQSMTVEYMLGDHLGSTSITTDSNGAMISEMRYKPWGELRYSWTDAPASTSPTYELTRYQYTGQYSYDVEFGLKYYGARFYDSAVGRFVSADTVIPGGTQGYDRFAYANNNPLRYVDPSGHNPLLLLAVLVGGAFLLSGDTLTPEAKATMQTKSAIDDISKNASTDVEKLTSMFSGNNLPGNTPQTRLNAVLTGTAQGPQALGMQFRGNFGDSGFAPQFQDGQDQVGHFLTAVGIGYRSGEGTFGLSTIVGHEMFPDWSVATAPIQIGFGLANGDARDAFMAGTEEGFQQVYDSGFGLFGRNGNSMADIRLSYWGWYLGMLIDQGCFQTNEEVATWIDDHIANGSTEKSICLP